MSQPARHAIFISHATPHDNAPTLWLGSKLAALGYEVWADIFRLRGGDDWERILEDAIRNKAAKFLLIGTPVSVQRQGVRNEVTIAVETAKRIKDNEFVVPLRFAAFDAPFLIVHAQYVDFAGRWAEGLKELVELLDARGVPRPAPTDSSGIWQSLQALGSQPLTDDPERLVSTWLPISQLPDTLSFYDFAGGISIGAAQKAIEEAPRPLLPYNRGFLAFAQADEVQAYFGPTLPLRKEAEVKADAFMSDGWSELGIELTDGRRKLTDLLRRALNLHFETLDSLRSTEVADGRLVWWQRKSDEAMAIKPFAWAEGTAGRRQIVGHSKARHVYWHYGINCWAQFSPIPHLRISGRVIFTTDGFTLVGDARRMHKMRRSFCRSWRNDRWRDLMLSFIHRVADGASRFEIPLGADTRVVFDLPPLMLDAPFGALVGDAADEPADDLVDESEFVPNEDNFDPNEDEED